MLYILLIALIAGTVAAANMRAQGPNNKQHQHKRKKTP